MKRLEKAVHHTLPSEPTHKACSSLVEWCQVRVQKNNNYKSNKFKINGQSRSYPVMPKAHEKLMEYFRSYYEWEVVKAVIKGEKGRGTQPNESFNGVVQKISNKSTGGSFDSFVAACHAGIVCYEHGKHHLLKAIATSYEGAPWTLQQRLVLYRNTNLNPMPS